MSKTILLVDDSATVRQQLSVFLKGNGYQVLEAGDGSQGVQVAEKNKVNMIIVDVNMPVMNGIQMIGAVRKIAGYEKTPIFVLTTESNPQLMQEGKAVGATAWIVKPFKPDVMLKGIQKVLGG